MKQALDLIDQLIEIEQQREREFKSWCLANHKANQTDGESKMLYHLKVLKELVKEEYEV